MDNSRGTQYSAILALFIGLIVSGCPRQTTGYLVSLTTSMHRQPIDLIRREILAIGNFDGPIEIGDSSTLCSDEKRFTKLLPETKVVVNIHDCFRSSTNSETGWTYSVGISVGREGAMDAVKNEINAFAEEVRRAAQRVLPSAKITQRSMEMYYGFSLLPY